MHGCRAAAVTTSSVVTSSAIRNVPNGLMQSAAPSTPVSGSTSLFGQSSALKREGGALFDQTAASKFGSGGSVSQSGDTNLNTGTFVGGSVSSSTGGVASLSATPGSGGGGLFSQSTFSNSGTGSLFGQQSVFGQSGTKTNFCFSTAPDANNTVGSKSSATAGFSFTLPKTEEAAAGTGGTFNFSASVKSPPSCTSSGKPGLLGAGPAGSTTGSAAVSVSRVPKTQGQDSQNTTVTSTATSRSGLLGNVPGYPFAGNATNNTGSMGKQGLVSNSSETTFPNPQVPFSIPKPVILSKDAVVEDTADVSHGGIYASLNVFPTGDGDNLVTTPSFGSQLGQPSEEIAGFRANTNAEGALSDVGSGQFSFSFDKKASAIGRVPAAQTNSMTSSSTESKSLFSRSKVPTSAAEGSQTSVPSNKNNVGFTNAKRETGQVVPPTSESTILKGSFGMYFVHG